jgi:hypothetical protein
MDSHPRIGLVCSCGQSAYRHSHAGAQKFTLDHFSRGHVVRAKGGEGYPVVRRFVIRRLPIALTARSPWILRDRSRPAYLGHYATHELALAAVARKLREERGDRDYIPTRAEIRQAMSA